MKALKKIAPNLRNIKKENIFRVPEGYFEEFPGRMMERITRQEERQQIVHPFRRFFRRPLAVAAAIMVFAILGYLSIRYLISDGVNQQVSSQEIAEYIEYYASDLDEEFYYEVLDEIDVDETADQGYDEIVIDYLLDQGVDYQSIIENL